MSSKQTATVKWFQKSHGFLTNQSGDDVFIHYSDIITDDKYAGLKAGQHVEYVQVQTDRGYQAKQCEVVALSDALP